MAENTIVFAELCLFLLVFEVPPWDCPMRPRHSLIALEISSHDSEF